MPDTNAAVATICALGHAIVGALLTRQASTEHGTTSAWLFSLAAGALVSGIAIAILLPNGHPILTQGLGGTVQPPVIITDHRMPWRVATAVGGFVIAAWILALAQRLRSTEKGSHFAP